MDVRRVPVIKKLTTDDFVNRVKLIHKNYYDYSLVIYNGTTKSVIIRCPKHGIFTQIASNHIAGKGCKLCVANNKSKKECIWLDFMCVPDDAFHRNVVIKIGSKRILADGYIPNSNVIYEFLGDFWHGNPAIYNSADINGINKKTYGELFQNTVNRIRLLRENGYKVISIWEKRFDRKYKDEINNSRKSI